LAVLKLAVLVSGVLVLAKLGFLDFITGGFDTGRFGGLSNSSDNHIFWKLPQVPHLVTVTEKSEL
jgi:hypothetical protein